MTNFHASLSAPRWSPKTESDLQDAIDGGLIEESHFLDAKESLATKGDNRELARDLASFANDGGLLIVGLAENKANGTFTLAPQPLNGLPEKIEQVARTICDPPLNVVSTIIGSAADQTHGYVIVHIPASPAAPHMVDNYYYGRNDKTKHKLNNDDVLRLHQRQRAAEQDVLLFLREEIDEDPLATVGDQSHLFLVAHPVTGRPEMLLDLTSGQDWNQKLWGLIEYAYRDEVHGLLAAIDAPPTLQQAGNGYRRARGAAKATPNLGEGRRFTPIPNFSSPDAIELQVFEDGGLRLYSSRLSETAGVNPAGSGMDEPVVLHPAAVNLTRRLLGIIVGVSEKADYYGNWSLAVGVTRLRGRPGYVHHEQFFPSATRARYERDEYVRSTGTTWAELNDAPGTITYRLLGPLLRALGAENYPGYDKIFGG